MPSSYVRFLFSCRLEKETNFKRNLPDDRLVQCVAQSVKLAVSVACASVTTVQQPGRYRRNSTTSSRTACLSSRRLLLAGTNATAARCIRRRPAAAASNATAQRKKALSERRGYINLSAAALNRCLRVPTGGLHKSSSDRTGRNKKKTVGTGPPSC